MKWPKGKDKREVALLEFIEAVEATGGVIVQGDGLHAPVADLDWVDVGEAYVRACAAMNRIPQGDTEVDQA